MTEPFIQRFNNQQQFQPPANALVVDAIDMHTGGEPLRVITKGYPSIQANSLLDYRRQLKAKHDDFRTALMFEPRGHADMYGAIVLPPFNSAADCSVIFMHNEGYSSMCGHATIAIMTLAMQMGWVEVIDGCAELILEAPCGLIQASGKTLNGQIEASFKCVPSFVSDLNQSVYVESLQREIHYDLAYGGAFYAYVDARPLDLALTADNHRQLIDLGEEIKQAVIATSDKIKHPFEPDLSFLYGTIFIGDSLNEQADDRNVCIFADGEVDRSPTGSGVSGRMAINHAKNLIQPGDTTIIESIIGSSFMVEIDSLTDYGPYQAVIPKVTGHAFVCGINQFIIQPEDQLSTGFLLR